MMKAFSCLFFFVLLGSPFQQAMHHTPLMQRELPDLKYQIIRLPDHTFGYQVLNKNKVIIDQPYIPGLPGKTGFTTEPRAATVARLVIGKIGKGEMPPVVSIAEMERLKVLD